MNELAEKLNEKLSAPIMFLSGQRHLKAIKMAIIGAMPLLTVLGTFLLIISLGMRFNSGLIQDNKAVLVLPYFLFNAILFIYISYGIGSELSISYGLDGKKVGFISIFSSFLILYVKYINFGQTNIRIYEYLFLSYFPTIIISIISVELYRLFSKISLKKLNLKEVPVAAIEYLDGIISIFFVVMIITIFANLISVNWITPISNILTIVMNFIGSYLGMVLIVVITCLFWILGIHGVAVIGTLIRPFWFQMIFLNAFAQINGFACPYIANEIFYQWFIWVGGSGCTIGLVLLMRYLSKSSHLKDIGKSTFISSLFNINEGVIFGTPISCNKDIMIPFLIAPLISGTVGWFAMNSGLVNAPFILVPWVLPAPIGAFISTGGDISAIILCAIQIIISVIVYYPFFKSYDNKLFCEENKKCVS